MDQRRLIFLSALLLAIIAGAIQWYDRSSSHAQQAATHSQQVAPESIVSGFAQTTFAETGALQYQLRAEKVTHFSRQAAAEMTKPDILFYRAQADQDASGEQAAIDWQASAASGVIREDQDTLTLSGDVRVTKPLSGEQALKFDTESLTIKPKAEVASTEDPVTVTQALHVTRATGLHIDIANGKVELLSQVRSQYVPASTPPQ